MANVVDLLGSANVISRKNPSLSKPFMFYQLFNMTSAILAPATICLMIAGWCYVFEGCTTFRELLRSTPLFHFYVYECKHIKGRRQLTPVCVGVPPLLCSPGSFTFIFSIDGTLSLVLAVIPPAIYLGLSFKLKADTQIHIAAVMSIIYAFLMLVVTMSIIGKLYLNKCNLMQTFKLF